MKEFFKENIIHILVLIFLSMVLIFGAQIISACFVKTVSFENLHNLDDRIRCAESLGWQVDKGSETVRTIYIPEENTREFAQYNEMQKLCGFDLSQYMGTSAQVYTYRVLNFPSKSQVNAFLNLIIHKGIMIGGDCAVDEYDELYLPVKRIEPDTHIPGGK